MTGKKSIFFPVHFPLNDKFQFVDLHHPGFIPGQTSSMKRCRGFFLPCSRIASHARRRKKHSMFIRVVHAGRERFSKG